MGSDDDLDTELRNTWTDVMYLRGGSFSYPIDKNIQSRGEILYGKKINSRTI